MTASRQPGDAVADGGRETRAALPRRTHLLLLAATFVGFAIYGSLVPLRFTPISFSTALERFAELPALGSEVQSRTDWATNVLLFIPIGFFALGALGVDRRRRWAVPAVVPVAACCAALSVTIEFAQLWFPPRTASLSDIAAQMIGGLVGCVLWVFIGQTLTDWLRTYTRDASPKRQVDWLLQAYLLGLVIYSVLPLDLTISVADLYRKFQGGKLVAVPFSYGYGSLFAWVYQLAKDVVVFVPIGAWAATAFVGRGRHVRSLGQSVLIGGLVVVAIELAQLFVYSRFTDTTDVIMGTAGVALGAALMRRLRGATDELPAAEPAPEPAADLAWLRWLGIAALYAAMVTACYWFPFDFSADKETIREHLAGFFGVPFAAMYSGSEFKAVSNLLQKTLVFAPLGALLTIAAWRMPVPQAVRRIFLGGLLLACFGVAFGIELGQVLSPRHTPDFTDVILCTAGALAGMIVTVRLKRGRSDRAMPRRVLAVFLGTSAGLAAIGATALAAAPADVVVAAGDDVALEHTPDFVLEEPLYVQGRTCLIARSSDPRAKSGKIRIAAPAGTYYVYVAWVRHPQGATDVAIRAGGHEARVDQSRLACGLSPDDLPRDGMNYYRGLCSSGLYRLSEKPVEFREGDAVEILRSDTRPGTYTTLDYVVFSPHLYLDDLGNDARPRGRPTISMKEYPRKSRVYPGYGLVFLEPEPPGQGIDVTVPAEGFFSLAARVYRGPNRAEAIPVEIEVPGEVTVTRSLEGKAPHFDADSWQDLGTFRAVKGTQIRVRPGIGGVAVTDLLRLTPRPDGELLGAGQERYDTFTVQWHAADEKHPWLRNVRVVPASGSKIQVEPFQAGGEMASGVRVRVARRTLPLLGRDDGVGLAVVNPDAGFRVELAGGYGFTLTTDLLLREPFVWLRDLGVFACARGDFSSHATERAALEARVDLARQRPFRSPSEEYFEHTGYDEARRDLLDRAFRFAYRLARPPAPRVAESLEAMPEVDYEYFVERIADVKHRCMFLGWPNVAREFYVLSNGCVGISSGANAGTGHPPPEHFTVELGAGTRPEFREHGDPSVVQAIEDGYYPIIHTKWTTAESTVHAAALAYPLAGEEVRTGNEPLGAFVRWGRTNPRVPLWLRIKPDNYKGPPKPLENLADAKVAEGKLWAGDRIVLGFDHARASVHSADPRQILVRLIPEGSYADVVIPDVAVDEDVVERAMRLGFMAAYDRTKRYWDGLLAGGTSFDLPDAVAVHYFKTLYCRTLATADLDEEGTYVLKAFPGFCGHVWLNISAQGVEALARTGHFGEARRYLEPGFAWQGSRPADTTEKFAGWEGFFNSSPRYTGFAWLNSHGWFQWAAARYFLFSDDRAWLEEHLPALVKSLEWTARQRRLTMKKGPDGKQPANYGWLPAARASDGSQGTSTHNDCINWMGFNELVNVLERIGHPRAAEFREVADDYRQAILRGLRASTGRREPVRLRDGTFVPYVPGYLDSEGHETDVWYAGLVDTALEAVPDSGVVPPGDPLEDWLLRNLEDNLLVAAPNLADEGHYLGHALGYLRRDRPKPAIYTFYSLLATQAARQTRTPYEHRSWGDRRVYELNPWALGYYTRLLSGMLCYDEGKELTYCRATPRAWLDAGKSIRVADLQTRFGPTSFTLAAEADRIVGELSPPTRYPPAQIKLRLRVDGRLASVELNGQPSRFDPATGDVAIPTGAERVELIARVARRK